METCSTPGLRSRLASVAAELAEIVASVEPGLLSGDHAQELTNLFARTERLAAAGTALTARRAAQCGAWRKSGERNAVDWLARTTGTPKSAARAALETADRVEQQPEVAEAWRAGALSAVEVGHIAAAVVADPTAAGSLVRRAATDGLENLRDRCRHVTAAAARHAPDEGRAYQRIHAKRSVRTWSESDGTGRIDARLTPEALAEFTTALAPYTQAVFDEARAQGTREDHSAYRADALRHLIRAATTPPPRPGGATKETVFATSIDLAGAERAPLAGPQPTRRPPATIIVRVDHAALSRGHLQTGETCEIDGIGPIPVALAQNYATDAFLAAVITEQAQHDNIHDVIHLGRNVTARQHTALVARDPHCVVPGCHTRTNLEIDHVTPWALTHQTQIDQLARLCQHHHHLKTYQGWQLHGPPGRWTWEPPGASPNEIDPRHPATWDPVRPVAGSADARPPQTTTASRDGGYCTHRIGADSIARGSTTQRGPEPHLDSAVATSELPPAASLFDPD